MAAQRIVSIDVGKINFAYCVWDCALHAVTAWDVCAAEGPAQLCELLGGVVDRGGDVRVIIERQQPRNTACVRIEAYCEMFFACRGLPCSKVDPRAKFGRERMASLPYRARKAMSVEIAGEVADELGCAHLGAWSRARKRDDLADALLQLRYHIGAPNQEAVA